MNLATTAAMWPTPQIDRFRSRGGERKDEKGLDRMARDWPTPIANDGCKPSAGKVPPQLGGEADKLQPMTSTGTGTLQEKEKALLAEILAKLNDLFQGDVTDDDQLIYVNHVLMGKLMESATLAQQAVNNTKEQFSNSPALIKAILDAIIDAFEAHWIMSKQALDSATVRERLKEVLLGPGRLYEALRIRYGDTAQPAQ